MNGTIRVNATAISHRGKAEGSNGSRFYMNGKFTFGSDCGSVQVSLENSLDDYIFAVCENLEGKNAEKGISVSVIDELKKYQEKTKGVFKDLDSRLEEVCDCVKEVDNLMHSMHIGSMDKGQQRFSFSGLVLVEDKAAVANFGSTRVCLIRNGRINKIHQDSRKAEKLAKLGILSEESPGPRKDTEDETHGNDLRQKKCDAFTVENGDVLLLFNQAFYNRVSESKMLEIVRNGGSTDYMAAQLASEALKHDGDLSFTLIVIRIHKSSSSVRYDFIKPFTSKPVEQSVPNTAAVSAPPMENMRHFNKLSGGTRRRRRVLKNVVSTLAVIVILAGIVYVCYNWIKNSLHQVTIANYPSVQPTWEDSSSSEPSGSEQTETQPTDSGETDTETPTETPLTPTPTPQATPSPTPTPMPEWEGEILTTYTVQAGDNLRKISKKFYDSEEKYTVIMEANGIVDPNKIQLGQKLKIPKLN